MDATQQVNEKVTSFFNEYRDKTLEEREAWATDALARIQKENPELFAAVNAVRDASNRPELRDEIRTRNIPARGIPKGYQMGLSKVWRNDYGSFWKGCNTDRSSRQFAVKVIEADIVRCDPIRFDQLAKRLNALANEKHENIVGIIEAGIHEGRFYLVMDWLDGESLANVLSEWNRNPDPAKWKLLGTWMAGLASAIEAARRHGLILDDLKPDNFLFSTCDPNTPKFIDVDGAILNDEPSGIGRATGIHKSPEHTGKGRVGPSTPVYSLGMILYSFLADRKQPFPTAKDGSPQETAIQKELPYAIVMPRDGFKTAEEEMTFRGLLAVVYRCLRNVGTRDRHRYPDGAELEKDLRLVIDGKDPTAAPLKGLDAVMNWYDRKGESMHGALVFATRMAAVALVAVVTILLRNNWDSAKGKLENAQAEAVGLRIEAIQEKRNANEEFNENLSHALKAMMKWPFPKDLKVDLGKLQQKRPDNLIPSLAILMLQLTECREKADYDHVRTQAKDFVARFQNGGRGVEPATECLIKLHQMFSEMANKEGGLSDSDFREIVDARKDLVLVLEGAPQLRQDLEQIPRYRLISNAAGLAETASAPLPKEKPPAPNDALNENARTWYWRMVRLRHPMQNEIAAEILYLEGTQRFGVANNFYVLCKTEYEKNGHVGGAENLASNVNGNLREAMATFQSSRQSVAIAPRSQVRFKTNVLEGICSSLWLQWFPMTDDELRAIQRSLSVCTTDADDVMPESQLICRCYLIGVLIGQRDNGKPITWQVSGKEWEKRREYLDVTAQALLLQWKDDEQTVWKRKFAKLTCDHTLKAPLAATIANLRRSQAKPIEQATFLEVSCFVRENMKAILDGR